ncbi:hypothetical protein IAR50_006871 [Cryptococcus sp. DSM 104548]
MAYRSHSSDSEMSISTQGPASLPSAPSPLIDVQYHRPGLVPQFDSPRLGGQNYYQPTAYAPSSEMPRSMAFPATAGGYYTSAYGYATASTLGSEGMGYPQPAAFSAPVGVTGPAPASTPVAASASTSSNYAFGQKIIHQDRPFKCEMCQQSFNRNHDLKRHKRIHLSVKPFACEKCGKTFSRKDALRRHWLVKGCREDGATAPIFARTQPEDAPTTATTTTTTNSTTAFPTLPTLPALSPPTPSTLSPPTAGGGVSSPTDTESVASTSNFPLSHPHAHHTGAGARPSLATLTASGRQTGSDLVITPGDVSLHSHSHSHSLSRSGMASPISSFATTSTSGGGGGGGGLLLPRIFPPASGSGSGLDSANSAGNEGYVGSGYFEIGRSGSGAGAGVSGSGSGSNVDPRGKSSSLLSRITSSNSSPISTLSPTSTIYPTASASTTTMYQRTSLASPVEEELDGEGKGRPPAFAMPFPPLGSLGSLGSLGGYVLSPTSRAGEGSLQQQQQQQHGQLNDAQAPEMEKQPSQEEIQRQTWQRWHRPSFPFPPPTTMAVTMMEQSGLMEGSSTSTSGVYQQPPPQQ